MPSILKLTLNAIGLVSNIYALRAINSSAFENPYSLGFGGHYQYLTILGLTTAVIALTLKIIRFFIPSFFAVTYELVTNIATSLEGLISVLYWSMVLIDPHLLIPKDFPGIPLKLDLALHLYPAVILWIDFLAFEPTFKRANAHVFAIFVFTVFYFVWSWYCYTVNGYWPYPFLGEFTLPMRIGFFAGSGILCWGMYEFGAKIHQRIHATSSKVLKERNVRFTQ